MTGNQEDKQEGSEVPKWQKLYDSQMLLLVAGMIVMFVFYTIWGMIEIYTLPKATLP